MKNDTIFFLGIILSARFSEYFIYTSIPFYFKKNKPIVIAVVFSFGARSFFEIINYNDTFYYGMMQLALLNVFIAFISAIFINYNFIINKKLIKYYFICLGFFMIFLTLLLDNFLLEYVLK